MSANSDGQEKVRSHWNYRLVRWACGTVALHEVYHAGGKPGHVTLRPIDFLAGGPDDGTSEEAADEVRRSLRMGLSTMPPTARSLIVLRSRAVPDIT